MEPVLRDGVLVACLNPLPCEACNLKPCAGGARAKRRRLYRQITKAAKRVMT